MSYLDKKIKEILDEKNLTYNWLSEQIGYSRQGLKNGLVNKTIKFETLEKIAKALNVPIEIFIGDYKKIVDAEMNEFYSNSIVNLSINRYDKVSDKLNYMKDIYVWEFLGKIKNKYNPLYPFVIPGKPKNLIPNIEKYFVPFNSFVNSIERPYSKYVESEKKSFLSLEFFFEGFYFTIFFHNLFNINDYLNDKLIQDNEINKYWKEWNKLKDKIEGINLSALIF